MGKNIFHRIAVENNIRMMRFVSFLWKYNFLCFLQQIRIETHFSVMSLCFNLFQVVINFIINGLFLVGITYICASTLLTKKLIKKLLVQWNKTAKIPCNFSTSIGPKNLLITCLEKRFTKLPTNRNQQINLQCKWPVSIWNEFPLKGTLSDLYLYNF